MSYNAQNWVRTLKVGNHIARHVLLELANHFNDETKKCYPSLGTLSSELELPISTLRRALSFLTEKGFITAVPYTENGMRRGTNYVLNGYVQSEYTYVQSEYTCAHSEQAVCSERTEGISTVNTGVCSERTPNKEYKQGNKQVSNTESVVCAENENTPPLPEHFDNLPVEPDYDSAPFFDPIPMEAYAEEVQPPVKPKKSTTKAKKSIKLQKPEGMSEDALEALIEHRKAKGKPMTQRALDLLVKEFDKAGMGYDEAVDFMIFKGWTGLKADWDSVKNRNQTKTSYQANGKGYVSTYAHLVQNYYYEDDKFVYYIDHDSWQPDDKDPLHSFEPTDMMELNGMGFYRQQIQKIAKSELDEKKKVKNLSTDS